MLDLIFSRQQKPTFGWKLKQEKDLFAKVLLVAHRLKGKAREPGCEPREFGGSSGCIGGV